MSEARSTVSLQYPDVQRFMGSRLSGTLALQMVTVAIGWLAYDLTNDPFMLGLVGLLQFLPSVVLILVTGHVADRFERRLVVLVCLLGLAACAVVLALFGRELWVIFTTAVMIGALRAFLGPAMNAILPRLLPTEHFGNAVSWNIVNFQLGMTLGPALGGFIYALTNASTVFWSAGAMWLVGALLTATIKTPSRAEDAPKDARWHTVIAGMRYVWQEKPLFAAISLDLVAVLLGGAVALMPIFARDILTVGPVGLGMLRAAPAVGAAAAALVLTRHPFERNLGKKIFAGVFVYGLTTLAFGVSRDFWLSLVALLGVGAADMASLQVRQMLVQLSTPDAMRGRVGAVNSVFVGASNELGEFRSGVTAALWDAPTAVWIGGVCACIAAVTWSRLFPALWRVDRISPKH